ncbi:MAG: hypothetical protein QGI83_01725 [Candidatus Latescibacteria bacterium]|nr:hypothetical protein [Candidatus Latescibacterota bacterium]|tara:strand:- start:119 stop:364 length:246 start_codon:yes stop_codon:yes gene_type:complete
MEIGDQVGVALLAVLGSLILRRLGLPKRVMAISPLLISMLLVWVVPKSETAGQILLDGVVSGLLASGILYVLLGGLGKEAY